MTRLGLLLALIVVASRPPLAAQQAAPAFDVATVRPSAADSRAGDRSEVQPSGLFIASNMTLDDLVRGVFDVQRHELVLGDRVPAWFGSQRWDITGKGPPVTNEAAQRPLYLTMMRNLLIERFKLVTRREARDTPVYALVVARNDRTLGPQMRPSSADCAALLTAFRATGARQTPDSPVCGVRNQRTRLWGTGILITDLTRMLSPTVGRPVVDATGLTGSFDIDVKFTPDDATDLARGAALMTAIQDQLGLRLEPRRAPVDVLVIESVERPAPE
jgi:uncharacterized protein (TIGR03435 family)